jgi:hypothetical protein
VCVCVRARVCVCVCVCRVLYLVDPRFECRCTARWRPMHTTEQRCFRDCSIAVVGMECHVRCSVSRSRVMSEWTQLVRDDVGLNKK